MQNKKRELKVVLVISKTEIADTTFKTVEYENLSYQSNNIPSVKGSTASKPLLRTILGDGGKLTYMGNCRLSYNTYYTQNLLIHIPVDLTNFKLRTFEIWL